MSSVTTESNLQKRRAGVLLHPSSLPGKQRLGTIGQEAFNFLYFMKNCGLSVWQVLPLGPTHSDGSPYQCLSTHAGNPELIELDWLANQGWLSQKKIKYRDVMATLSMACDHFFEHASQEWRTRFDEFLQNESYWLEDYALFMALKKIYPISWTEWPLRYRLRDDKALREVVKKRAKLIRVTQFTQFVFFTQWHELKDQARLLGISLFGDMPIYVSPDSCDVWSRKEYFLMDQEGHCEYVAGVPPDAFSETGQLWGNPLYDWDYMQQQDFDWWIDRFKTQLKLFDIIRIDHFRGLESYWRIPGDAETAIDGEWVKTPGAELLQSLRRHFEHLPLVAEDLGVITNEVIELRTSNHLPGMLVLQFAFDGDPNNLYLPHNHYHNAIVYTGTHDNDTTVGWFEKLEPYQLQSFLDYLGRTDQDQLNMPEDLNRMALASVAKLTILPMQDLLKLGSEHRMNTPGTIKDNWSWQFDWDQVWPELASDLRKLIGLYGRYHL
jgi:4-alpha-glucanotransferase